ncbi:Glucose oxidase [Micractinium conductrix]|uniref:Glucose oxidase n=1 Tax=Micractinium conductrix TaxID=554055 RepID=A0A2P6VIU6_9CHLO|nr:Glucose oxidase [Micractinium conductrix]|eukprot:PSC74009.1 Glucose oxidase [Micractinium conductrix]
MAALACASPALSKASGSRAIKESPKQAACLPAHHVPRIAYSASTRSSRTSAAAATYEATLERQLQQVAAYAQGCLSPTALEQAFRIEHPGLLEALTGADVRPASAARLLGFLEAELPPALTDVAPGGDCVLVALAPGLLPLLGHPADCCEASLAAGDLQQCVATGKALLSLLARLRFGGRASAAGYAAVATRCKQALKGAYDLGALVRQEDVVELETACSRSSPWLWLTPYFGHRYACIVDGFISAGWRSGELAVQFTEAYCSLVGRGRYTQVPSKFVRLVHAALSHPLSASQLRRLVAAAHRLPVEMSIELSLHARTEPADSWYGELLARLVEVQSCPPAPVHVAPRLPAASARNCAVPVGAGSARRLARGQCPAAA